MNLYYLDDKQKSNTGNDYCVQMVASFLPDMTITFAITVTVDTSTVLLTIYHHFVTSYDIPGSMRSPQNGSYTINNSSLHRVYSYGSGGHSAFTRSPGSYPGYIQGTTPTRLFSEGSANPLLGTNNSVGQKK